MTGRLPGVKAAFQTALRENADLLYRHTLVFSDGTKVRCSVHDPNRTHRGVALAIRLAQDIQDLDALDLRLLKCHVDDQRPNQGSRAPWQGGTLTVEVWSQVGDFTGLPVGICRWGPIPPGES